MPALAARGLVEEKRILLLFRGWRTTPAGAAQQSRIQSDIERARTIPALFAAIQPRPPRSRSRLAAPYCWWRNCARITANSRRRCVPSTTEEFERRWRLMVDGIRY